MHSFAAAGHVRRVVEHEGPSDRGHRGRPCVVGLGPGGQVWERVADRRPVRQVGGLDDLDVPRHRIGGVREVGLSDEDHVGIGEVERVDEAGGRPAIERTARPRDGRDVLGGLVVVIGRDLAQGVLDAPETRLERVDAGALQGGVHVRGGQSNELVAASWLSVVAIEACRELRLPVVTAVARRVRATSWRSDARCALAVASAASSFLARVRAWTSVHTATARRATPSTIVTERIQPPPPTVVGVSHWTPPRRNSSKRQSSAP